MSPPLRKNDPRRLAAIRIGVQARRSYIVTFVVIGTLAAISFALKMDGIRDQQIHVQAVANAQETSRLVQHLGLLTARLQGVNEDPVERAALIATLYDTHQKLKRLHDQTVKGDPALNLAPMQEPELRLLYFGDDAQVDFKLRRLLRLVDLVLANPASEANHDIVYQIVNLSGDELPEALKLVIAFHKDRAFGGIQAMGVVAIWIFAGTIGVLLASGMLIFRPLVTRAVSRTLQMIDAEDALKHSAQHDSLTGLANRLGIATLYKARAGRRANRQITALHIDLETIDTLYETHGHAAGDDVIRILAARLRASVREHDIIGRIGDGSFAIIMQHDEDETNAIELSERIQSTLSEPVTLSDGGAVRMKCRVGVAQEQSEVAGLERLMTSASIALHEAEQTGDKTITLYSPDMRNQLQEKERLLRELDIAIDAGDVFPYFQPQVNAKNSAVVGFEALVRWQHSERGLVPPGQFIDLAEDAGMGGRIGALMLRRGLEALTKWEAAGFDVPQIGINFSSGQLMDPKIVDHIKLEMDRYDLSPDRLGIEILETVMVESEDHVVVETVQRLKKAGYRMELDDFGTGHASISNLRRFQVDRIKIDRGFVSSIDTDAKQRKMVLAMVRMAEGLGIEALAEGVETPNERQTLQELGVVDLQGYGIGRPMPFSDTITWLTENRLVQATQRRFTG